MLNEVLSRAALVFFIVVACRAMADKLEDELETGKKIPGFIVRGPARGGARRDENGIWHSEKPREETS